MTGSSNRRLCFFVSLLLVTSCTSAETPGGSAAKDKDDEVRFGVAVKSGDKICLSFRGKPLADKAAVTLVNAMQPQSTAAAVVGEKVQGVCAGIKEDQSSYQGYAVNLAHGSSVEENTPLIVAIAPTAQFRKVRDTVEQSARAGTPPVTFRACASADGVHLTAWRGKALQGKRLWHLYYYLGQDLETNCTTKETAP